MKKAQGLEMNTIIMMVLILLVAVVLISFFSGKVSIINKESECVERGGSCERQENCEFVRTGYRCADKSAICCMDPSKIS